jgi:hypothetical protein
MFYFLRFSLFWDSVSENIQKHTSQYIITLYHPHEYKLSTIKPPIKYITDIFNNNRIKEKAVKRHDDTLQ